MERGRNGGQAYALTTGHFVRKGFKMIQASKTSDTPVVIACTSYRELQGLTGTLNVGGAEYELSELSERQIVTIAAADLADIPEGDADGYFEVCDSDGKTVCKTLLRFRIVDGEISGTVGEVVCVVPSIPNIDPPKLPALIDKAVADALVELTGGTTPISKLCFVDSEGQEYELTAITEDGYPMLKVEPKVTAP